MKKKCPVCKGTGKVADCDYLCGYEAGTKKCSNCKGTGKIPGYTPAQRRALEKTR